jgi:hypothetical protein
MRLLIVFISFFLSAVGTFAHQEQTATDQEQRYQEPLPAARNSFSLPHFDRHKESSSLPDAPLVKKDDRERTPCPAGDTKPCAFLGGMRYFRDLGHMTEHDRTVWQGFKHPLIMAGSAALIAASVYDIEGTQACLQAHTCREANPIFGSHPNRLRAYSITMPVNGLLIYLAAREKRRGDGNKAFAALYISAAVHAYFGKAAYSNVP